MKTLSKQQIAYEALFDEASVFEDDDVWEILEKKAAQRLEVYQTRLAQEYMDLYTQYFCCGECRAHERVGCAECSSYVRGECPSTREEGYHMTSIS